MVAVAAAPLLPPSQAAAETLVQSFCLYKKLRRDCNRHFRVYIVILLAHTLKPIVFFGPLFFTDSSFSSITLIQSTKYYTLGRILTY